MTLPVHGDGQRAPIMELPQIIFQRIRTDKQVVVLSL